MGDITLSLFDVPSDYVSLFDQNQVAGCHAQFHRGPYPSLSISEEAQKFLADPSLESELEKGVGRYDSSNVSRRRRWASSRPNSLSSSSSTRNDVQRG